MANKPADRNAEAPYIETDSLHVAKPRVPKQREKPDKMHLYVNGKHALSTDAVKAHEVAKTYMREFGNTVWLSRKVIRVD